MDVRSFGLEELQVHYQVVHSPIRLYALAPNQSGQLCIVPDAVKHRMEQDRFPGRSRRPHGAGDELDPLIPVDVPS